jgi:hypothetical protein
MIASTAKAPTPPPIPAIAPVDNSLVESCWSEDVAVADPAPEVVASDGTDVGVEVAVFKEVY